MHTILNISLCLLKSQCLPINILAHSEEKDHPKILLLTLYAFTDVSNILEKYLIQTRGFFEPLLWEFMKYRWSNIHPHGSHLCENYECEYHTPCRWKPRKALSRSFRETYDQPDKCMTSSFSWSVDEQNLSTQSGKKRGDSFCA